MKISLKNIIVPSIPLAVLSVGFCFALWMSTFFIHNIHAAPDTNNIFVDFLLLLFIPNSLVSYLLSFSFNLLNAFLLAQLNNKYTLIRTRTFLPILIFLLLMGSWSDTHSINGSHISLTLYIFSLFYFFGMPRDPKASEKAFMCSLMLSLASLFIQPIIFLIPVCWAGFIMVQSFSLRTFLASIFGALAPWLLYIGGLFVFQSDFDLTTLFSMNLYVGINIASYSIPQIIYYTLLTIIAIVNLVGMYSNAYSDAMNTRVNLNFLILQLVSTLILIFVFNQQFAVFLPIIAFVYSVLVSHAFTLKNNNFYVYLFILFLVLNIFYAASKFFKI